MAANNNGTRVSLIDGIQRAVVNGDPAVVVRWGDRPVVVVTAHHGAEPIAGTRDCHGAAVDRY